MEKFPIFCRENKECLELKIQCTEAGHDWSVGSVMGDGVTSTPKGNCHTVIQ